MAFENLKRSSSVLKATRELSHALTQEVLDLIVSNASNISGFKARRTQLTEIKETYLFYYALSLVLFGRTVTESWAESEVNAALEATADELSRDMLYRGASSDAVAEIRASVLTDAHNMYFATRDNFRKFSSETHKTKDMFNIMMLHLMRIFPGVGIFLTEGHIYILSSIMKRFGTVSMIVVLGSGDFGSDKHKDKFDVDFDKRE